LKVDEKPRKLEMDGRKGQYCKIIIGTFSFEFESEEEEESNSKE
jgi:hypothetical protein